MNRRHLPALLAAALLAGCATPYDQLRNYAGPDAGTIVASVGTTAANTMNFASIEFRRKNATDLGLLQFSPKAAAAMGGTPTDFTGPAGSATLLQKRLPPGDYEIIRYSSGSNYGTSMVFYTAPENFSIPFSVRTGQVTYLGQYLVGLNLVGGRPSSSYLEITDESQRDLAKAGTAAASATNEAANIVKGAASGTRRLNAP